MLYAILGLALLMIVHEAGHFFVARAFKMRVEHFAIGIGPTIWRHQPKGSDTVYQVGLIPFLAYVRIAGMNPFEEIEADDKGSYANASLTGRISAIIAGPLANYLFASVVFFGSLMLGGKFVETTELDVMEGRPAAKAGLETGDRILSINGKKVSHWEEIPRHIKPSAGHAVTLLIERKGQTETFVVTPEAKDGSGIIGVSPMKAPMPLAEAAERAVVLPAAIVGITMRSLVRWISGEEEGQITGPLGIMRETKKAAEMGFAVYLHILGFLSTSVGFFNMLPVPALDGGRLVFLAYEAITRRRPNQKVEAQIHMLGMVMLLAALALVTFREWGTDKTPSEQAAENAKDRAQAPSDSSQGKPASTSP